MGVILKRKSKQNTPILYNVFPFVRPTDAKLQYRIFLFCKTNEPEILFLYLLHNTSVTLDQNSAQKAVYYNMLLQHYESIYSNKGGGIKLRQVQGAKEQEREQLDLRSRAEHRTSPKTNLVV